MSSDAIMQRMVEDMGIVLEDEDKRRVEECIEKLEKIVNEYGDHGFIAYGVLGQSMAASLDENAT